MVLLQNFATMCIEFHCNSLMKRNFICASYGLYSFIDATPNRASTTLKRASKVAVVRSSGSVTR